jgi:hypothetical protein
MRKFFSTFTRSSLFFLFLFFLFSNPLQAAELSFAWTPNSDPNLAGYKIYYGTASRAYTVSIDVGNPTITDNKVTCTLTVLPQESTLYYFAATAYDVDGLESDYSTEVVVDVSAEANASEAVFMFLTDGFPLEDISAVDETALLKIWQDQKLSRDLYQSFYTAYSLPIYANMLSDAQHHMDFMHILLGKFGVSVPQDVAGLFADQEAQNLFDLMLNAGNGSAVEALRQGAAAEDMTIADLQILLPQTDNLEIQIIYQNLLKSARNHLRLIIKELSQAGIDYDPQYISDDDFAAIIVSPVETGIYNENGDTIFENGEWLVTSTLIGPNQIDLTWTDPTPLIDAASLADPAKEIVFQIMRSTNGGVYTLLAEVPADATGYSDTTVVAGNTYEYRVFAVTVLVPDLIGYFRTGTWVLDTNGNGVLDPGLDATSTLLGFQLGDVPVTGDWNGDGISEIGIFRKGTWYLDKNGNGVWDGPATDAQFTLGLQPGDVPVTGDWNGDGITEIGVFRKGTWYLDKNGNGAWDGPATDAQFTLGLQPGDVPVTGDWNGDGTTKIGIFRKGTWYLDKNGNGAWDGPATDAQFALGLQPGDVPVTGDWNGDGTTEIGAFRSGTWYLDLNGNGAWNGTGTDESYTFGQAGDKPVSQRTQ